uniref:Uncharacterized protein n=1 Tax=Globisporangium ultimum (strain ATCC 200006 / CBS 805.95 / DAOM BR144) TaxID=431595 RepID=K3W8Z6_GLOUD
MLSSTHSISAAAAFASIPSSIVDCRGDSGAGTTNGTPWRSATLSSWLPFASAVSSESKKSSTASMALLSCSNSPSSSSLADIGS